LTQGPPQPQQPGWGAPQSGYGPPQGQQWAPQGQGQQGWGAPQPPKPKPPLYRRPWFIIVGVLALVVIFGALVGDPPAEEPTGAQPEATQPPQPEATQPPATEPVSEAPGIGNSVRDGKFEFTVRKIECGKSRIGDANFGTTAQGQFCFVYLKVENIGKEAQLLDGSNQYMFGEGGQRYDADTEAAIYLDDAQTFLEEINPGNSVNGIVAFDIPKSAKPTRLELHDSAFSGGVEVEV
jgi:Domain of unknown function (DUF4352)